MLYEKRLLGWSEVRTRLLKRCCPVRTLESPKGGRETHYIEIHAKSYHIEQHNIIQQLFIKI
jgi:hypothetical protein